MANRRPLLTALTLTTLLLPGGGAAPIPDDYTLLSPDGNHRKPPEKSCNASSKLRCLAPLLPASWRQSISSTLPLDQTIPRPAGAASSAQPSAELLDEWVDGVGTARPFTTQNPSSSRK